MKTPSSACLFCRRVPVPMPILTALAALLFLATGEALIAQQSGSEATAQAERPDPARFAKSIDAFEAADKASPPPENGVLFVGSSSFRMWDVERFFPKQAVINRGFGGSTFHDAIHYADRIILPYKPSCILIYEGDNDIAKGLTPEETYADFEKLLAYIDEHLPGTPVIVVAVKPSIARWDMWPEMRKLNRLIEANCDQHENRWYADIATPMFEFNGLPKAFVFKRDALHLNDVGYTIWKEVVDPLIAQAIEGGKGGEGGSASGTKN